MLPARVRCKEKGFTHYPDAGISMWLAGSRDGIKQTDTLRDGGYHVKDIVTETST